MNELPKHGDTILIIGTDLSGKNHIANIIAAELGRAGRKVEKREGKFSAPPSGATTSEDKSPLDLLKEQIFLLAFPVIRWLIPLMVAYLLKQDLRNFKRAEDRVVLVISHTALRVLAFYLAHVYRHESEIRVPPYLDRILRRLPTTGVKTLVLDIEHQVREQRAAHRLAKNKIDHFDRYMARNPQLSERVEEFLVWLSHTYLGATTIINNDLSEQQIIEEFRKIMR